MTREELRAAVNALMRQGIPVQTALTIARRRAFQSITEASSAGPLISSPGASSASPPTSNPEVEAQRRANPAFARVTAHALKVHRERMAGRMPKPR